MPNPKTITERLTKDFEKLNLEQPVQLHRLLHRCEADLATLRRAQTAVAEQAEKAKRELAGYEERRQELLQKQKEQAGQLEVLEEVHEDWDDLVPDCRAQRSSTATDLRQTQLKLQMLKRDKKDWELTSETMRHFEVDIKEAIGVIEHIIGSLKRNLDRLKIATMLRREDEVEAKFVAIAGLDLEVDLSQADVNQKYHCKLLTLSRKIQRQMNRIARKSKFKFGRRLRSKKFDCDYIDLDIVKGEVFYKFVVNYSNRYTNKSLPDMIRDQEYTDFFLIVKSLPDFVSHLEQELQDQTISRREEYEELSQVMAAMKAGTKT